MHVIIFLVTLFFAPTPTQPAVKVVAQSMVLPAGSTAENCKALAQVITVQANQDPKVLDVATGCFEVVGKTGIPA